MVPLGHEVYNCAKSGGLLPFEGRKSAQAGVRRRSKESLAQVERIRWRMDTMKNSLIAFGLVILLSFGIAAQSGTAVASNSSAETAVSAKPPDVPTPSVVPLIGAGTGVVAELSGNINAKKAKPGDRVKAQVTQDVLYRGRIVMRVGTKLIGHVQAAKPFTKEEQESQLNIVFDKAELKGGGEVALMGNIRC